MPGNSTPIPIMPTRNRGHQFVIYGDSCSGIPDALHESTFREVNAVIQRLAQPPEFICFPGDEIMGLTTDEDELRRQWDYWFTHELAWLNRDDIPLYHTTGNHTTYDTMSETVFRQVMAHLPRNGPEDQQGLSYFVRRDDLLMIFVHTLWSGLGGEGNVETEWLNRVLQEHSDARHKLVFGHHPVFTVNGFAADYQRNINAEHGQRFWDVLVRHGVLAYVCSHILAFDVQVHQGILQICTAGAGTAHRMPENIEYLHAIQAALDDDNFRYQVIDTDGQLREWLVWNWEIPPSETWQTFDTAAATALSENCLQHVEEPRLIIWEISGEHTRHDACQPQTLFSALGHDDSLPYLWLGISGQDHHMSASLSPQPNRSPHSWHGPPLDPDAPFSIQFAIHSGMGPGGILWRWDDNHPWSTLSGSSAWGVQRLRWSHRWTIGSNNGTQPFLGKDLMVKWHHQTFPLHDYVPQH